MGLSIAPRMRYRSAVVFALAATVATGAHAADPSIPETVTNAFETIVIDATKAASKAATAAKNAIEPRKSKSRKKKPATDETEPETPADETADIPLPERNPKKPAVIAKNKAAAESAAQAAKAEPAPTAKPEADKKADAEKQKPTNANEWPAAEVELARARCTQLLKGVDAVTIPEPPMRQGDCGSMAPVRLVSIGKSPEVALSPPPVVSCELVVALTKWVKEDVQPAAKRHLGSEVIRMESMSDYSCRMAYGRIGNKLSEHGKANALDIRSFTTRKGDQAVVLAHWGETRRDVLKEVVAARAAAEKAAAAKIAAEKAAKERAEVADAAAEGRVTSLPRKTLAEGLAKDAKSSLAVNASVTRDGDIETQSTNLTGTKEAKGSNKDKRTKKADRQKQAGKRRLSREEAALVAALPPEEAAKVKAPPPKNATARFLHGVHASGCQIFGTTLGPEANEAHRNHFHVDMAERKFRKICD
ncbi:extensin family protein [Hyphomicrobium sp. CS1GBMeth3]|uniref:extensin-like domain-containing protein n=1 Tax=Hyphomicrobium sp. CS1GBMeth3 TaxID=1892845 RepID=UPI000931C699|nr:extensin family protein [Hyphomicrobium sp. CS1GBMeth3]